MIDGSEKRNRQLAFDLQSSHVCEKRSKQLSLINMQGRLLNLNWSDRKVKTKN